MSTGTPDLSGLLLHPSFPIFPIERIDKLECCMDSIPMKVMISSYIN